MDPHIIITIDGPSGVGKSTIAKNLAEALQKPYLNTGAMFRVLALQLGEKAYTLSESEVQKQCKNYIFQLKGIGVSSTLMFNHKPIPSTIYSEQTAKIAAKIALIPVMRTCMKQLQRKIGISTSLVAEGRDLGTEVFPEAQYKFFLDANINIRAQRRLEQLKNKGENPKISDVITSLEYRDRLDRDRVISPLVPAHDAIIINTSNLKLDEVIQIMLNKMSK